MDVLHLYQSHVYEKTFLAVKSEPKGRKHIFFTLIIHSTALVEIKQTRLILFTELKKRKAADLFLTSLCEAETNKCCLYLNIKFERKGIKLKNIKKNPFKFLKFF